MYCEPEKEKTPAATVVIFRTLAEQLQGRRRQHRALHSVQTLTSTEDHAPAKPVSSTKIV